MKSATSLGSQGSGSKTTKTTFSINLNRRVEAGLTSCGKFDGSHACLVAATSSGNVLVHSPHRNPPENVLSSEPSQREHEDARLRWTGELAELQIGREVTALEVGRLGDQERDVLLVGTSTHVLAYQVEDNADLFYRELADGAYCIAVGKLGFAQQHQQVVIVGGNCSITILDAQGEEIFWTVARDKVTAVAVFDFDADGFNELISGTSDHAIKAQKGDSVLWENVENASVLNLHPLPDRKFAYATEAGTVGVYGIDGILWRIKSKHKVSAIRAFDLNGDGSVELLTGWSSGKVDARLCENGQVVFKVQLSSSIAGIVEADYRRTGRADLVVVTVAGEIRGFASTGMTESVGEEVEPGEFYRQLVSKKQALQMELKQRNVSESNFYMGSKLAVSISSARGAVRLGLASGPGLLIHYAMVFAEGIFEGGSETLVVHPSRPQGELEISLSFPKNGPVDVHVKTCVGSTFPQDNLLMVLELTHQLPQFCMYEAVPRPYDLPEDFKTSGLTTELNERAQRVALWLNQSLVLSSEIQVVEVGPEAGSLEIWLRGLRDQSLHCLEVDCSGKLSLRTQDPEFAGDVVQSLAVYLGLRELTAEANFPLEEKRMTEALQKLTGFKEIEARMQAETAGSSGLVKNLIVRLEDSRILENTQDMRTRLAQLKNVNKDLIRDHEIRSKSFAELVAALKELNYGVQNASRIRVGKSATNAVQRCRSAIKEEDPKALALALRHG